MTNTLEHALRSLVRAIRLEEWRHDYSGALKQAFEEAEKLLPPVPREFPKPTDELVYVFRHRDQMWMISAAGTFGPVQQRMSVARSYADAVYDDSRSYKLIPVGQTPPVSSLMADLCAADDATTIVLDALKNAKALANGGLVGLLLVDLEAKAQQLASRLSAVKQAQQREEEKF